jgi:energy-coupling factor transporter ATP-binding protein EcfA2
VSHSDVPILKVEHLSYRYPTGQSALCDVSFKVGMHEVVGLVGPNGAGKTTLLLHLNGLLMGTRPAARRAETAIGTPFASDRGASDTGAADRGSVDLAATNADPGNRAPVEVLGMPVIPDNFPEVRRVVGILFQDPDDQLFCPTVRDDVAFGPLNLDFPRDEVLRRVGEALSAVGLSGFEDRSPAQLSFGEKRRVCLAGVLAGMLLRVRAYLFLGVSFLFLVVFARIWHAAVDHHQPWVWWASGICLGAAILALFAVFEKRRNDVLRAIEQIKTWH